jgi:hypothetical protein
MAGRAFSVAWGPVFAYLEGLDVHLQNPELQAKLNRWVTETGRGPDELVEDAMAGYFDEPGRTREMLDSRCDDLKSGRVQPIDGEDFLKAAQDITEIWEHIAEDNPLAARRVRKEILNRIRAVVPFPRSGHTRVDLAGRPLRFILVRES